MNDNEVLAAVRDSFSGVRMRTPLEQARRVTDGGELENPDQRLAIFGPEGDQNERIKTFTSSPTPCVALRRKGGCRRRF